ncbi:guanosine diphosphatase [Starmerella bacillaris]|uniref:guanosine-diphosphatase n=1 Tax=Starmerella bacillaris TaxID=1247836 RepID=A0AAV5RQX6_STABA|nr:guanosine diphosphatase [Starmerella bacillaris]
MHVICDCEKLQSELNACRGSLMGLLPVSDFDNPHMKKQNRGTSRVKLLSFLTVLFFCIFALYKSTLVDNVYKSKSVGSSAVSSENSLGCTKSYDGVKPIEQYVIMIDAGSSGSRVHVYKFNNCQKVPVLVNEEFLMIEPGLSKYAGEPMTAAHSLDPLMDVAMRYIPEESRSCSPIAVKATAGLRKLGEESSNEILNAVRNYLETEYPFPVVENGVEIMSGEEEGVYAWVTANYLLGKIGSTDKTPTVAVFDLGGGSTQLVFEPSFKSPGTKMLEGDHKYSTQFGGRHFDLYQHSYLGYGLNEARNKINQEIISSQKPILNSAGASVYRNPCLPPNVSVTAAVEGALGEKLTVEFEGPSVYSPMQCRKVAESILNKEKSCTVPPCAFDGVHQPMFHDSFPEDSDMYIFSFFYDRTSPLGMPSSFNLQELRLLTALVCQGESAYSAFDAIEGAVEALKEHPQWCTDLNYIEALLGTGYEIKGHRDVKIAKKINGKELGWCLGASLPLLDKNNWICKK